MIKIKIKIPKTTTIITTQQIIADIKPKQTAIMMMRDYNNKAMMREI
jgi:hypothetical protein